ncbi:MAG: 3-carboxymuconate cyclase, partial [Chthoniobacteraceae bacterium]|nr:3-carboxymuconate cyclase [Chthoniobacteraceae bacterium]
FGAVYQMLPTGEIKLFASFSGATGELPGSVASSALTPAGDGNLYGVTESGGPEGAGTLFKVVPGQKVTSVSFTGMTGAIPGIQPQHSLTVGLDGNLYGTTRLGGPAGVGSIFRVALSTGAVTQIATFTGNSGALPGFFPKTSLAVGGDGFFYGTADTADGIGLIFKVNTAGVASRVALFTGNSGPLQGMGRFTSDRLTADGNGNLYGASEQGGLNGLGTIFKITPGAGAKSIASFTGATGALPGAYPYTGAYLVRASNGFLYGTTQQGGAKNSGTIFRVSLEDTATTVASFTDSSGALLGATPRSPLTEAPDGTLYGTVRDGLGAGSIYRVSGGTTVSIVGVLTGRGGDIPGNTLETPLVVGPTGDVFGITQFGGVANTGTMFRINLNSGLSSIGTFVDSKGSAPRSALTYAADGFLYGTAPEGGTAGGGVIFRLQPGLGGIQPIFDFTKQTGTLAGTKPWNKLVAAGNGRLYGTTLTGGAQDSGTVFEIVPGGPAETRASFGGQEFRGSVPSAELTRANDGRLFGSASPNFTGAGALFSVSLKGDVVVSAATLDSSPGAALRQANDGKFYGITTAGGTGFGTVFVFDPSSNSATVLAKFTGQSGLFPGRVPRARLSLAVDGSLYGTTTGGGAADAGTIFKVTPGGSTVTVASFTGVTGALPGAGPGVALVQGADNALYGVTSKGGAQNVGTLFRLVPGASPTVKTVASFTGLTGTLPGNAPSAELVQGPDGNLYGTTNAGGSGDNGVLFQAKPGGAVSVKAVFTGRSGLLPGAMPIAPLELAPDGNLYGTTSSSGTGGGGTVFRVVFGPTVKTDALARISFTEATFSALVNPNGAASEAWFEYGTSTALGFSTNIQVLPEGSAPVPVNAQIAALIPGTTYYVRGVARNAAGIQRGTILSFQTKSAFAASSRTTGASGVTVHEAFLAGSVTANGESAASYFEFGTTTSYGTKTSVRVTPPEARELELKIEATGLLPHTLYHFRSVASNPSGTGYGDDSTFTTLNTVPIANNKTLHAPAVNESIVVYTSADVIDADGDSLSITVARYTGTSSASSNGSRIIYKNDGFVGNDVIHVAVSDGFMGDANATVTMQNAPPVANDDVFSTGDSGAFLDVLGNDSDPDQDQLRISSFLTVIGGSATSDGRRLHYVPDTSFNGHGEVTYIVSDLHGGTAEAKAVILANYSVTKALATQRELIAEGESWGRFGPASIFSHGTQAGWLASVKTKYGGFNGIYSGALNRPVLQVRSEAPVPNATGTLQRGMKFEAFQQPVFADGSFGFIARIGGDGGADETGIWVSSEGLLRGITRSGGLAPGANGAKYSRFLSLAMPGTNTLFFVAKLDTATPGVTPVNNSGLWVWTPAGIRLALRSGQTVDMGHGLVQVKSFQTLSLVPGAAGHGGYDATEKSAGAVITFSDGSIGIATIGPDAVVDLVSLTGEKDRDGRVIEKFGTPSSPGHGQKPVAMVTYEIGKAGISDINQEAIFDFESSKILAQTSASAPGIGTGVFKGFKNAIAGFAGGGVRITAFEASVKGSSIKTGIWAVKEGGPVYLVAAQGAIPPGADGARFKEFQSVSVVEGRGPLFKATLKSARKSPDEGLWATDSNGTLRLLIRTGDVIDNKTLRTFSILEAVPHSMAQRRAWSVEDPAATLIYIGYFTDGTSAVLTATIP